MTAGPAPAEAYAKAPDSTTETQALINIGLAVATEGKTPLHHHRPWLLRQAALVDRSALQSEALPAEGAVGPDVLGMLTTESAVSTARALLEHDRLGGAWRGPLAPSESCWDEHPRGYVRQEYLAWRAHQLADRHAVGAVMRATAEVGDDSTRAWQDARQGRPWSRDDLLDLARRKVQVQRHAVDFGIDAVADQYRAEAELAELEGDADGHPMA